MVEPHHFDCSGQCGLVVLEQVEWNNFLLNSEPKFLAWLRLRVCKFK
jgi:hypothetical protein